MPSAPLELRATERGAMQMLKTYQGYFNEGQFVPFETVSIPNNVEVYVVITDNALAETKNTNSQKQKEKFERFLAANRAIVDEPFAVTAPPEAITKMSRDAMFGCMRGQFKMADDFDAPLEDFKENGKPANQTSC